MKNEQWEAIHVVFEKMEQLCVHLQRPASSKAAAAKKVEPVEGVPKEEIAPTSTEDFNIVKVRAEIRTQLDFLRVKLAEQLTERDCYLVLFPIVAYFDEHVKTCYLAERQLSWPPLQKELFQIDDAGEIFYDTVDDLLRKPQTIPFIYEVYYFCLNQGFQGRYVDNPVKINEYMKKLREKIPVADLSNIQATPVETGQVTLIGSAVWYYLASAAVLALCYLLLLAFSHYWDLGFDRQETGRSSVYYQQRPISFQTAIPPEREESMRNSVNERRTIVVKPIRHIVAEPRVLWEEAAPASAVVEVETDSQTIEKMEVTPAAVEETLPEYPQTTQYVYSVQVSSFRTKKRALTHLRELQGRGFDAWLDLDTRGGYHRVLVGKYEGRSEALAMLGRLQESKEFGDALQVKVEIEAEPAPPKETLPRYSHKHPYVYSVQVGSYRYEKNALTHLRELQGRGFDAWLDLDTRGGYHRVLVGEYKGRSGALAMLGRLQESKEFGDALQVKVEIEAEPA
ncbi:MAG: SPOR domain-containing protein, partial [Syntrophobacterales bacterium]